MNRIEKNVKEARKKGEGIISCSLAPRGDRDYDKLITDVQLLIDNGLNQLLLIFYEPQTMYAGGLAPAEILASKDGALNGTYMDAFFDTAKVLRQKFPDLPIIGSGIVNDIVCYGMERFIRKMKECDIDGIDTPVYKAVADPAGLVEISQKYGISYIPPFSADVFSSLTETQKELLHKTLNVAEGELFFIPGMAGAMEKLNGESFKESVEYIRSYQDANNIDGLLIGISGINTPEDCYELVKVAGLDGVHFSSAYLKRVQSNKSNEEIGKWLKSCKDAMK